MGFLENQLKLEKENLRESVRSNYAHGKCLIKLQDDFRGGKIDYDNFRIRKIYHQSVINEQTKWGFPLGKLDKKILYLDAKKKVKK